MSVDFENVMIEIDSVGPVAPPAALPSAPCPGENPVEAKPPVQAKRRPGHPKKFTENQLIELWRIFTDEILDEGFLRAPTQTEFCRWLARNFSNTDRKTIYNSLNKYFPNIKKEFKKIQEDVLAQGALTGRYNPTMTIFCLKNWCSWSDCREQRVSVEAEANVSVGRLTSILNQLDEPDTDEPESLEDAADDEGGGADACE